MRYFHVRILVFLSVIFLGFAFLSTPPSPVHAAGNCKNVTCEGLYASTMGCPAYTAGAVKVLPDGLSTVETRASGTSDCDAKWARAYNKSGASRYVAASLRYGCANFCYAQSNFSPSPIPSSSTVGIFTPMHAYVATPTRSCARVEVAGPIPTPVPVSTPACTTVN